MEKYTFSNIINMLNEIREKKKNNQNITSKLAQEILVDICSYSIYCDLSMQEEWKESIRNIIYNPITDKEDLFDDNYNIANSIYNYIDAGRIMKTYFETKSWKEVKRVVNNQCHTIYTFPGVVDLILKYSLIKDDFLKEFNLSEDIKKLIKKDI